MKHDNRKKGLRSGALISKAEIEPHISLTNKELAAMFSTSEYMVKKSLVAHGLYKGTYYTIECQNCGTSFNDFLRDKKFCSNHCKHEKQAIWNRGLTAKDSPILEESARRMQGNQLGKLIDQTLKNRETLHLPTLNKNVTYDKSSKLEKEWLLLVDSQVGIIDVKPSTLAFTYHDEFGDTKTYYPDYEVEWETGLRWLVEIKGIATDKDYAKIEQISRWAKENRYDYRIITTGMVKKDNWHRVFSEYKSLKRPTPEWIMMSHACSQAMMSPSFRLRVGAIITTMDCDAIYSYGFNGDERGGANFPISNQPGQDGFIHAEENALLKLNTDNPVKMFVTNMPCINCAKRIINAKNVKEVYYLRPYRDTSGVGLLVKAGIKVFHFQETDFEGNVYNSEDTFINMLPGGLKQEYLGVE